LTWIGTALSAFATGAAVGALAVAAESWLFAWPLRLPALAAYAAIGGLLAAGVRAIAGAALPAATARVAAITACSAFAWLELLYFVNVRGLPSEHFLSAKSLAVDVAVSAAIVYAVLRAARTGWVAAAHARVRGTTATVGALALLGCSWGIADALAPAAEIADAARPGTNLALLVLDSARRDHLGLYGYAPATSQALDAFAPESRVFWQAYSASSWTIPSVQAMLAVGQRPEGAVPGRLVVELARRGYATACFTDNPHLTRDSDVLDGFQHVGRSIGRWRAPLQRTVIGGVLDRIDPGDDARLTDTALAWAAKRQGPFFLYLHLMDSHTPYRRAPIDGQRRGGRNIQFPRSGMSMTPDEVESVRARYDGGVRSASAQAARVLSAAPSWKRPLLAVITSDHGESLGEEGRWFHNYTLAPELLAIPMLVYGDGVRPGAVKDMVGHASVAKTFLSATGTDVSTMPGSDLRTSTGEATVEGGLPPDLSYRISDGHKIVVDQRRQRTSLFDVRADPREIHDVGSDRPEVVRALSAGPPRSAAPVLPAGNLEQLKAFGYGSPIAPRRPGDRSTGH
jgi:arylsulfatase A-like enzyme